MTDPEMIPFQGKRSSHALPEIIINDVMPDDERLWVPLKEGAWTRPLCFNISEGYWTHLLRVRKSGVFNRHRHASPVHGYVIKGKWRYLEHDWVATEGSYIFEPPGDTHTLVVPEDCEEMITFFHTTGVLTFVDPDGTVTGSEDVFARMAVVQAHFEAVGLGADYIKRFIR